MQKKTLENGTQMVTSTFMAPSCLKLLLCPMAEKKDKFCSFKHYSAIISIQIGITFSANRRQDVFGLDYLSSPKSQWLSDLYLAVVI